MNIHEQANAIVTENPALRKQVGTLSSLLSRRVISADNEIQFDADDLDGSLGRLLDAAGDASAAAIAALATANDLTLATVLSGLATNVGAHDTEGVLLLSALLATTGALTSRTLTSPVIATGVTASGSASNDLSGSTGTFKSSTGANTLGGAVSINDATTPSLTTATGKTNTGFLTVLGKTSGGLKITAADVAAYLATVTLSAQTVGATALSIPDFASVSDTFAFVTLAQSLANKTLVAPVISTGLTASGSASNNFAGSTGAFATSTGANTIGGVLAIKVIATAVAAAGSSGSDAAALGAANLVTITSDSAAKGVKLLTGVAGQRIELINRSSTAAVLYPATGGTINGLAANAGVVIAASKGVIARCTAADTWFVDDTPARATAA